MRIDITDSDIERVEKMLLPAGCAFDDERRTFIKCMESRDVVACPGSGKTTALLAKLLILAQKQPFDGGRGICVLTHTNVAINEIKKRAGDSCGYIFAYPNFFGTIQTFVNSFLAIPCYRTKFHHPTQCINDDRYLNEVRDAYRCNRNELWALEYKHKDGATVLADYWFHPRTLQIGQTLDEPIRGLGQTTPTYRVIHRIRMEILRQGFLSYKDAYSLALRYLEQIPSLVNCITSRFRFLFMDEAQDTEEYQFRVLNLAFDARDMIIQRIGDPNQAIFHQNVRDAVYWQPRAPLRFSESLRFGDTIARVLTSVRVDQTLALRPSPRVDSLAPHILTFRHGEEKDVLAGFSELVGRFSGTLPKNGAIKAVAWVCKSMPSEARLSIPAYFPRFARRRKNVSLILPNLLSYLAHAMNMARANDLQAFREAIWQGVTQTLDARAIRDSRRQARFTPVSVQSYWRSEHKESYDEFRSQMAQWFLLPTSDNDIYRQLREDVLSSLATLWPDIARGGFVTGSDLSPLAQLPDDTIAPRNCYVAPNGVVVEVGTVHSVKGETHCATLYLETYYQKRHDSERLVAFLSGQRPKDLLDKSYHRQNLKVAHVAFSRASHLVAFACRENSISSHADALEKNGWVIRSVSDLVPDEDTQT